VTVCQACPRSSFCLPPSSGAGATPNGRKVASFRYALELADGQPADPVIFTPPCGRRPGNPRTRSLRRATSANIASSPSTTRLRRCSPATRTVSGSSSRSRVGRQLCRHRRGFAFQRCPAFGTVGFSASSSPGGGVSIRQLDFYLDEFVFRFNRRKSRSRGLLFYRLMEQAVATTPKPAKLIIGGAP
jgi:hypothetical protein